MSETHCALNSLGQYSRVSCVADVFHCSPVNRNSATVCGLDKEEEGQSAPNVFVGYTGFTQWLFYSSITEKVVLVARLLLLLFHPCWAKNTVLGNYTEYYIGQPTDPTELSD